MLFLEALLENPLLLAALLAGIGASFVSGIIGSYIVVKRIAFISGGIAHTVLGGIGFCLWLNRNYGVTGASPMLGALGAAILAALIIGWIHLNYREREDSAIAALWSIGMAAGVVFISQTPGFNVELTNYLVGNILWVTPDDLYFLFTLDALVLLIVLYLHKRFLIICFDEDQAKLQGVPVKSLYLLLLILIAITVVILVEVMGIILVMTMLTIPPAIANLFTARLSKMMLIAVALCCLFNLSGITLSFYLDWPAGATIALISGASYVAILSYRNSRNYVIKQVKG